MFSRLNRLQLIAFAFKTKQKITKIIFPVRLQIYLQSIYNYYINIYNNISALDISNIRNTNIYYLDYEILS